MTTRPIPTPKIDADLLKFVDEIPQKINKQETKKIERVKKSLVLKKTIDDALRLESAKTREKQIDIMETAISEYLRKKGYINI